MRYSVKRFLKKHFKRDSLSWAAFKVLDTGLLRKLERFKSWILLTLTPSARIGNLNWFEAKIFSQNGEDGILQAIFRKIGATNKYFVEFGVEDGRECNTRYLFEKQQWNGLWMDSEERPATIIKREFVTADNINELFSKYAVPSEFDVLSIDIDGNDYWVWKALNPRYRPRVVVMEYNSKIPSTESKVIPYDPNFRWDGSDYFGASLLALVQLGDRKGYTLVCCDREGVNAFFIRSDIARAHFKLKDIDALYRPPGYGDPSMGTGWPSSSRTMIPVTGDPAPAMCSIIIPTYNTCRLTLACLAGIQNYPPPSPYEVIVVDNHSADDTCEQVRKQFPEVRLVQNGSNLGFARACNQGAKTARGEFLLFLNSDTEPLKDTFAILLDRMKKHPRLGIVGPELLGPERNLLQMSWSWNPLFGGEIIHRYFAPRNISPSSYKQHLIHYLQRKPRDVPFICGASLMIRRSVFEELHGFDESFEFYFEDADLCQRCAEAGWGVEFVPASKIIHRIGQSTSGDWSITSLIYQQSHMVYYRKHAPVWGTAALKTYLYMKWLRLACGTWGQKESHVRAAPYCKAFRRMISESEKFTLADGIPR